MNHLEAWIGATADGACAIDAQQRIRLWNRAAERILGFHGPEVRGRHCYEVLSGTDGDGCRVCRHDCATIGRARRCRPIPTADLYVRSKSGEPIWINVTTLLVPASWATGTLLVHLFRDVDRQVALQQSVDKLVSEFAGTAAARGPGAPADGPSSHRFPLTPREREVLALLATGATTRSIAHRLSVSPATVRNHVHHILGKLGVHSRLEAVALALRRRWL